MPLGKKGGKYGGKVAHASAAALLGGVAWLPLVAVLAATPVEDRSTSGGELVEPADPFSTPSQVQPPQPLRAPSAESASPYNTPQPVLPDELALPAEGGFTPGAQAAAVPGQPADPRPILSPPLPPSPPSRASTPQASQSSQLFFDLQQLQTEVLQLRGLLEDQSFEIQRLRELQRSQYLDIDRRLTGTDAPAEGEGVRDDRVRETDDVTALAAAAPPTEPSVAQALVAETNPNSQPQSPNRSNTLNPTDFPTEAPTDAEVAVRQPVTVQTGEMGSAAAAANGTVLNDTAIKATAGANPVAGTATAPVEPRLTAEQESYNRAFDLMKDQQFEQSIAAYQGVIETFPNGTYAPESRYWLGELYLMADRLEDARGSFNLVVDRFPAHQKVPLSLYKLGVVNHRLGATPEALQYLDDVVVRYPDTPAAGLARTYAAELR